MKKMAIQPRKSFQIRSDKRVAVLLRLFCVSALLNFGWCAAATFTWTGSVSTDWFTPNNWSPVGVPGSSDTVNMTNGTINLSSPVIINGSLNWSGGSMIGRPLTIESAGLMNVSGTVYL